MDSYEPNDNERPKLTLEETYQFLSVLEYAFFTLLSFAVGLIPVVLAVIVYRQDETHAIVMANQMPASAPYFFQAVLMCVGAVCYGVLWIQRHKIWNWAGRSGTCPQYCIQSAVVAVPLALYFAVWNQDVLVFILGSTGIVTFSIGFFYLMLPKTTDLPRSR